MATSEAEAHVPRPRTVHLVLAFAALYVIWGSTYLAIRVAIESIPPFVMGGVRFVVAGTLLLGWARATGAPRATRAEARSAAMAGLLLLMCGNGGVVWAEQWVPSGLTALLVAMVPLWMVLLDWVRPGGRRPAAIELASVTIGFAGVMFLVGPGSLAGGSAAVRPAGAAALVFATLSWSLGSLYARGARLPRSPLVGTALEMIAGGLGLLALSLVTRQWTGFDPRRVSLASLAAVLYLVVFGSIVALTAYSWLLRVSTPAKVATYAYVNPVVAVILGALFADEPLTARVLAGSVVIVGSVALLTTARARTP